jgi:hypothetical protein
MVTDNRPDISEATPAQRRVHWIAALLTIIGAAAVEVIAYGLTLGVAGCTDRTCPNLGLANAVYGPVVYGAPVVAVVAIALSFVTARKRWGWAIPTVAWILLIAGPVLLYIGGQ